MTEDDDMVKLDGGVAARITGKAILFHTQVDNGETMEIWWPKSQVEIDPDDNGLWVPRWLVEKKEEEIDREIMLNNKFN